LVLIIDGDREIRAVRFPVVDIADAVRWALAKALKAAR
jgi:hypothetical protein